MMMKMIKKLFSGFPSFHPSICPFAFLSVYISTYLFVAFVVAVFFRSESSDMLHCLPELFQIERAKFLFFFFGL